MSVAYLDASAVVKLCIVEAESTVLMEHLERYERTISSELTVVEVARAAQRAIGPEGLLRAEAACARLDLLPISQPIVDRARHLDPAALRTLDAIHLATALEPRTAPTIVAYDEQLLRAAEHHGLLVVAPGR